MYIHVRVTPGAKKESIVETSNEHFAVSVREKAERNLANGRVRELLAAHYGLAPSGVRLVSGHRSPSKIFDIAIKK